jgi:hypothetical protein
MIKDRYQFIHFIKVKDRPKTSVWSCRNNRTGEELGVIEWYGPWRQYIYHPTVRAVYSSGCLADIGDFIGQLESERKGKA